MREGTRSRAPYSVSLPLRLSLRVTAENLHRGTIYAMAPAELLDGKEEAPAFTAARLYEYLHQVSAQISSHLDLLDVALIKK